MAITRHTEKVAKPVKLAVGAATTAVTTQAHIADPSTGATVDSQARTAINSILDVLEAFGLTATS